MNSTPDLSARDPVEVLAEEFCARQRCGERPTLDEYTDSHPDLAERIRAVFPALMLLEELGPKPTGSAAAPVAERLGEFRIVREVGRGGMGVVYEAVQEPLGRRVALKVLAPQMARGGAYLARFRREARTAARLHHTHIVPVYGVGEQDGAHFLAMQLIRGVGLDVVLAALRRPSVSAETPGPATTPAGGALAAGAAATTVGDAASIRLAHLHRTDPAAYVRAVADLVAQAADALAYAHAQEVVHRDIKPGNLLLDEQGTLWVSDFGLAKAEDGGDLTQPGFVVGTPRYLAPERFAGQDTPAGDVYALGATLYELLTLWPVFDGADRDRLLERIRTQEPVRPRALCPHLPRDLETVCLKALAKEPGRRYTAAELAADLRRFLDGRPVRARRIGPVERLARWARRNPAVAGLTVGLFLTLTIGLVASLALWRLAEHRGDAATANAATAAANAAAADTNAATAEAHRATAEARLQDAVAVVDTFLTRVSQETLLDTPGLQPLREGLLQDALQFYERFLAERRGDPALRGAVARTQLQIVRILRTLQRWQEAEPRAREAIALFEQLAREKPDDPQYQFALAAAYESLSATIIKRDPPAARAALETADRYLEPLVQSDPPNRAALYLQAEALMRLGKAAWREGRFADAITAVDRGRAVMARLMALAPDNVAYKRSAARLDIESTKAHSALGHTDEVRRRLEHARDMLEELRANGLPSMHTDFDLSLALTGLATTNAPSGTDVDGMLDRATAILEDLHAKNPAVPEYANNLAFALNKRAALLRQANRAADALPLLDRSQKLVQDVLAVHPDESDAHYNLGGTLTTLGLCYRTLNRHEDGLAAMTASRNIYAELRRQYPGQLSYVVYLGGSWNGVGNALNDLQRPAEAQPAFEAAIACQREVLAAQPNHALSRQYLANHTLGLARVVRNQGRLDEAVTILTQYRDVNPRSATHLMNVVEESATWMRRFAGGRESGAAAARVRSQELALDALRRAAAQGYKNAQHLENHANFAPLRGLDEFQTLLQAVKANAGGG